MHVMESLYLGITLDRHRIEAIDLSLLFEARFQSGQGMQGRIGP